MNMQASEWSDLPLVLTPDQAALILQLKRRTVATLLDRGVLRGVKIGREWRVSRNEVKRFVEGKGTQDAQLSNATPVERTELIRKNGLLVVSAEPLTDLTQFVAQEREQRVMDLIGQAGL